MRAIANHGGARIAPERRRPARRVDAGRGIVPCWKPALRAPNAEVWK